MSRAPEADPEADRLHMRRTFRLAERGWGRVAPNPMVGARIVRGGAVVGEGWHQEYGRPHAEVEALARAGERARGATMYVSLEPCSHHGKTPPCTDAVLRAGIARLVYAVADPNPKARGGAEVLRAAGVRVEGGVEEAEGRDLNAAFLHAHSGAGALRPWLELKLALSLDARVADRAGRSAWLTGETARAEVHRLRAGHDAILVGIGTALADDPLLTVRGSLRPRVPPARVVLDPRLRLPPGCRLLATAGEAPVWVVGSASAPSRAARALEAAGATVLLADDLPTAMRALRERGVRSVFCEGGASLAGSLLAAGLVDRLTLFYAPLFLGVEGRNPFAALAGDPIEVAARWRRLRTETFGADTLISFSP